MTQATTKDYWISSTALHIELNALGYPDYVQASCVSGAQILVYVKDIIGYDAGHNYRRWPLQASPTVFNSHTEKYVYAAIPRSLSSAASAWIVFPSEQIDIYGKNANAEQIGDEKYYYIFLQGKITSSGDNGTIARDWDTRCFWGYLSSDEAISAIGTESEWYHYSQTDSIVTFLKKLTMKPGTWFRELFAKAVTIVTGGSIAFEGKAGAISGITNTKTPLDSETDIVTPKYLDDNALSSVHDDEAKGVISFLSGIKFISNNKIHKITSDGIATLKEIVSKAFRSGALGSGFKLGEYNADGDSYLEVDRLLVRKAAEFVRLVIRELQSVGGEIVLSPAAMKISNVVYFEKFTVLPEYDGSPLRYDVYRCYFSQKKGDEEIENQFVMGDLVRCQTYNVKEGVNENVKNRYYWRKVYKVGKDFIDLLADDCDTGSDIPQAGDELVQMGNVYDTARQSVVVLSAYGADAPSLKMYYGVNSYSLDNREVFVLSRSEMFAIADKFKFITRNANGEIKSTQSFAELVISVDGLRTTVNSNKEELDDEIKSTQSQITQTANGIRTEVRRDYSTKKDVNDQISAVSSSITQTATQIAMKVGYTLAERRNLLVGSLFRKQGEGFFLLRSKIYRTSAHEGANVIFAPDAKAGGAQWGGAANSHNIHVAKGKTYTLAFWARTKSAKVEIAGEAIWHSSATDTSRPGGYTGPNGSANLGVVTITPSNGWYLYQKTFTVAANAYEWISVACLKVNTSTASQQVYIAHPILIEGTAEDFVCWSASPDDYDYIGGNLLDNTRTFNKRGNLTQMDASVVTNESYNNGCSVIYASAASKYIEMAQWSVSSIVKKDEDYMFSFMAKGSGNLDAYMYGGTNLSIFAEDSERDTTTSNADGGRRFSLTSEWKRYWVHWRSEGIGIPNLVLIRCLQGGKAWVTMPKLEVGATPTDWIEGKSGFIEDSGIAAKLLRTGLDIENGKITATADRFEIRNNSGETTASVNEKGVLEVGAGLFGGFVAKKLTVITPDNIARYTIPSAQLGYIVFDFASAGSFVRFEGDFNTVFNNNEPVIVLPYYNRSQGTSLHSKNAWEAAPYLDQTFIVINNAKTTIKLIGGGTINNQGVDSPSDVLVSGNLSIGRSAILKCTLHTKTDTSVYRGNSFTIGWDGYIYG